MKIFVINLKSNSEHRLAIQQQADAFNLNIEFVDAVYGAQLSDNEIVQLVYDYPECKLTKGEIGCALSHLFIYEKIISENISHALILEDDAVLSNNIHRITSDIEKIDNIKKPNVYLLSKVEKYIENKKIKTRLFNVYKVYEASGTHGYLINKTAAKELLDKLKPIKYEADMWGIFIFRNFINVYCIVPHIIDTSDQNKFYSLIEKEMLSLREERQSYRHKLKKQEPKYQFYRLKDLFLKKIIYKIKELS
ncbi:glycosyltransferase family 25 protein [Xenorhabdus bharatensis]|uniref:glycosyltransferase family 25 protein n=1 Tax=Xenorhabdus bharatensis TaxID=3136256 RepID=UPI0030F3F05C